MKQKKCGGKRVRWLILLRIGQLPIVVFINKIDSEKAIEYITTIGKELKTGGDCESEYIRVDLDVY